MHGMIEGMEVTVKRDELLAKLRENREKHIGEHREAMDGWREQCFTYANNCKDALESDKWREFQWGHAPQAPQSFAQAYNDSIGFFEMATETEIELNGQQFKAFVRDDWQWKGIHAANLMNYSKAM